MKQPLGKLAFLAVLLYLTACHKTTVSSTENESSGITGKWTVVTDSTFEGVGVNNHPVDYIGAVGDYFDFDSTNGDVYTKEGAVLDTLTYKKVSNSSIIISDFGLFGNGVQDTSTLRTLTAVSGLGDMVHTMVIESPWFPTPGGLFWRKVTLRR